MRIVPLSLALAVSLIHVAAPIRSARGTTFVVMSTVELAAFSDEVAHGTVVATEARWQRGRIVTRVWLRPPAAPPGAASTWFEHPGGTVGGVTMRVLGMPTFTPGERVVVLLGRRRGGMRLVGMADGKLAVETIGGIDHVQLRGPAGGRAETIELPAAMSRLTAARRK